jgi:hypothetical protein
MQALLWGILNTHANALGLCAAFTRLAVLVIQVGAARQAGLLYGSGRCMIRQWLEDRAMCSGKGLTTEVLRSRIASTSTSSSSSSSSTFMVRTSAKSS